ncbi:unnamed protein product [Microthlaspi erraticum]|uniref:Uncharacterized protein n=1 Tax=Microthlaspi erraticum TaxID=1685480 RepID=A0A6D2IY15_9BRAS|nr:unnamed protein product [Microthlaspi erraticum]
MSRKGVIAKRVKLLQTALSRISAQTRSPAGRGTHVSRSAKSVRPTEVSAKVQNRSADHATRPGKHCPAVGQATSRHAAHDQPREPGNKASRPRNPFAYHGRCIRPSRERTSHVRPRNLIGQISSARPRRPTVNPSGHDRSDSATTRLSGRSSRPTVPTPRSTRSPF